MQSILVAAAHRGAYVPSRGGVRELFGSRIILSSKSPLATSLEADGLHVALIPVSGQLPTLDKKAEEQIAADFQSRFLGYFLRNFNSAQIPNFDVCPSKLLRARSARPSLATPSCKPESFRC